jgi:ADP-heptose:LPS heptosyltransferase
MTPDTMRMIDAFAGPPICFILTLRRWLLNHIIPRRRGALKDVKKILFVKPAEMGSTVLMYPMLMRARELWPECEFHFLVFEENTAAVKMLGLVPEENIHTITSKNMKDFVSQSLKVLWKLHWMKFDVAMDLEFFSRASGILNELVGAKSTCGFQRFTMEGLYKGDLLSHPVQYNPHIHTALTFYSMIEALAQPKGQIPLAKINLPKLSDLPLAKLNPTEEEQSKIHAHLKQENSAYKKGQKLIILNANSSELVPLRRWPLERFIELGNLFLAKTDCFIVLTGVKSEVEESLRITRELGSERVINMVGKTTLDELLVLYSVCDLMVTNDSGPSHFASLTDLSIVTLFGPETPKLYGALGKNKVAISAQLACSPCVSSYNHRATACNDNICMKQISVERVFNVCQKLLNIENRT